jgi:methionine biosynthesis protein MetW
MRADLEIIYEWISPQSRVLDLGCGDGELLSQLQKTRAVTGLGMEIENGKIIACVEKGVSVVKQDLNKGLQNLSDKCFDTVVMTQSFQQLDAPHLMLDELLRVGHEAIVTFPNFGHWTTRRYLGFKGRMPMSEALPHMWFDTPNIHHCTFKDFEVLCLERNIRIKERTVVDSTHQSRWFINLFPNILGEIAIYRLSK